MTIEALVKIELDELRSRIEFQGYAIIKNTDQAINYILSDLDKTSLMYQEKENIRMFFESDKFKNIPNKDFYEFLKKY